MNKVNQRLLTVLLLLLMVSAVQYIMVDKRNVLCSHPPREYHFDVVDDTIEVYTEDDKYIGTVPLNGQLDSLITADNE